MQPVKIVPVLKSANETLLHLAAVQGMGLAFLPSMLVAQDIAAKRLDVVLPDRFTMEGSLYGVYPSRNYLSAKVRTFLDFVAVDARFR